MHRRIRSFIRLILTASILLIWSYILWGVFFPLFQDQNETLPFRIEAQLNIDDQAQVPKWSDCKTIRECGTQGDEIAYALFDPSSESPWRNAYEELKTFDGLEDEEWYDTHEDLALSTNYDRWIEDHEVEDEEDETLLAKYQINGDQIKLRENQGLNEEEKLLAEELWDYFTSIIPTPWRKQLKNYYIHHGGDDAGYIDASRWVGTLLNPDHYNIFGIDLENIGYEEPFSTLTLLHEFAHLFSLDKKHYGNIFACRSEMSYDCHTPWSYLQHFAYQFWRKVDKDWIQNTDRSPKEILTFYQLNQSAFINNYAASNPDEDFAESFTAFIITPRDQLNPDNPIDQKQLFFYQYPELVGLRFQILNNLYTIWTDQTDY